MSKPAPILPPLAMATARPPSISLIVARARNGVIGHNGALPWRLKGDLSWFREQTLSKPVLMGRATWESLPRRPLPGRPNLVVSRSPGLAASGAWVFSELEAALAAGQAMAGTLGAPEVMVIGGEQIYRAVLARVSRLYLTEVDLEPEGNAFFPELDPSEWAETFSRGHKADADNQADFTLRILDRCG